MSVKFEMVYLSPAGVIGGLSGKWYKPLKGITVTVVCDHECMSSNPKDTGPKL